MAIKPILFSTDMVRAILDGRKTVTRRKIDINISNQFDVEHDRKTVVAYIDQATGDSYEPERICRYQPGDILYVRETWAFIPCIECMLDDDAKCLNDKKPVMHEDKYSVSEGCFVYRADCTEDDKGCLIWSPSIHMPKRASRIWLRVTDVKVERLQEITPRDMRNEGATAMCMYPVQFSADIKPEFIKIWNSTIKKTDVSRYGWAANPWVWVIEFERCEKPEGV